MSKNAIIDCETLSTDSKAIILQIAVGVIGDDQPISKMKLESWKLDVPCQNAEGRVVDKGTMAFWSKHPEMFKKLSTPSSKDQHPAVAVKEIAEFLKDRGFDKNSFLWQRGSKDFEWLASLAQSFDSLDILDSTVNWWQTRDVRTAVDVLGFSTACNGYMDAKHIPAELSALLMHQDHDAMSDIVRDTIFLRVAGVI